MKPIHSFIGCVLVFLAIHPVSSQSVNNIVASFDGERISITYDLIHQQTDQKFKISLFSSHNNYQKPIAMVRGDVGDNITTGKQKTVVWSVKNELPPYFNDDITIKVRASLITTIGFKLQPFASNGFKRGSNLDLNWQGGSTSEQIKIDLLKNNIVQQSLIQTPNTNSYQWQIPKKQKPGSTYALRISSISNPTQKATTNFFKIKPKVPAYLKIGVPILVGVLVGVLVGGGDNGGENPTPDNNELSELPGPISPGG